MRVFFLAAALVVPGAVVAAPSDVLNRALSEHIQPGFAAFADASDVLAAASAVTCDRSDPAVLAAFDTAWDAWIRIGHLRFGPTETDNRAFALGYWPDTRGTIPKTLARLVADEDAAVADPEAFAEVSIAGRGFTALEFLLFDPQMGEDTAYQCQLRQAIAVDIALNASLIADDWDGEYGTSFLTYDATSPFRSETEALTELFGAVLTGLEFSEDVRLGRPMGTFDRPRPKRAEAWRAGRSVRHIALSVEGTRDLSLILASENPQVTADVEAEFGRAMSNVDKLKDPVLGDVVDATGWLRAEIAAQGLELAATRVRDEVGALYGLSEGFSSLDGD